MRGAEFEAQTDTTAPLADTFRPGPSGGYRLAAGVQFHDLTVLFDGMSGWQMVREWRVGGAVSELQNLQLVQSPSCCS